MDRVKTLNKFQMPYYIRNDQLVLEQSYKFSEELIEYTRESLRKGFLQKKALFEVSCRATGRCARGKEVTGSVILDHSMWKTVWRPISRRESISLSSAMA